MTPTILIGRKSAPALLLVSQSAGMADPPSLLDLGDVSEDLELLVRAGPGCGAAAGSESEECGEYDSISSPGGSSTCSGPTYPRCSGFGPPSPRSQPIVSARHSPPREGKKKKKKVGLLSAEFEGEAGEDIRGVLRGGAAAQADLTRVQGKLGKLGVSGGARARSHKKEPLPMKLRALPQSFWQQPNNANPLSPGAFYSTLPPLPGQPVDTELDHIPSLEEMAGVGAAELLDRR